ncbi:DsbA family protein [Nonomuraea rubra]|uniref:Protein-disulfide isomerase n=1 Tax=Nonomuraea rubra TaxID=46180 RepID=A0A7X0NX63_9ACTN|nr:thioredoxin domain-containing protein [Nonomuraea rubra]MBB6551074.1 protein-disulfide isomerase [Nonomuraea rubra]
MGNEPDKHTRLRSRARVLAAAAAAAVALGVLAVAALDRPGSGSGAGPVAVTEPAGATQPDVTEPAEATQPDITEPAGATQAAEPPEETVQETSGETARPIPTWEGPTVPPIDTALSRGASSAPVTIVEFGDFKCVNCGRFAREIEPELRRRYIDTGVVRLFWRDFPAQGRDSMRAAIAGRAAARQGRFWAFHDAVYADQSGGLGEQRLRSLAARLGLDLAAFDADRRDPALREAVERDFAFGAQLGMAGTPAFLINGSYFFGAQPLSAFVKQIEQARHG